MNLKKATLIIVLILLVDQISKIYVKTHFVYRESIEVFSWFEILFIENEGAAWGTKLSDLVPFISDKAGKLILTLFRLVAIIAIGYWLRMSIKKNAHKILIIAVVLIFAGALGNIIDSVFYGVIFNHSYGQVATLFSDDPYGSLFYGNVVDMLHFDIIKSTWPDWVPWVGGRGFEFFAPVFNIADSAISIGVGLLIVFNKRAFPKKDDMLETEEA